MSGWRSTSRRGSTTLRASSPTPPGSAAWWPSTPSVSETCAASRCCTCNATSAATPLSWASLGATVTGLDFSPEALTAARELSAASGVPGRFVEAELYDAPGVLHERFDIVYTGVGALNWLPDVRRWAQVVAGFLRPGGVLLGFPETYTDGDARLTNAVTYEWNHSLTVRKPPMNSAGGGRRH